MKIIAYFLPQFHEIIENNEWWGEGFTEWTNIKKAKTLYSTHEQPIKPLDNYYYNLLEKETMIWQTKLLEKYKIEGLCYYHYWFEGKNAPEIAVYTFLDLVPVGIYEGNLKINFPEIVERLWEENRRG